jgi:hypothetical protein
MKNLICSLCDAPAVSVTFRNNTFHTWCKACGNRVKYVNVFAPPHQARKRIIRAKRAGAPALAAQPVASPGKKS